MLKKHVVSEEPCKNHFLIWEEVLIGWLIVVILVDKFEEVGKIIFARLVLNVMFRACSHWCWYMLHVNQSLWRYILSRLLERFRSKELVCLFAISLILLYVVIV